jgi:hypothetical protein
MQQVADWLEKLGLGQYAQRFADLTDQDLEKIGVAGPAWHEICGFDKLASPEPPPPAQLEAPAKIHAIISPK